MINILVFERKFVETNQAVYAWEGELRGADRSIIRRFLPENFLVATPMGLIQKTVKGGECRNGRS